MIANREGNAPRGPQCSTWNVARRGLEILHWNREWQH